MQTITREMAEDRRWYVWLTERSYGQLAEQKRLYPACDADGGSTLADARYYVNDQADVFAGVAYVHEDGTVSYFWQDGSPASD